MDRLSSEGAEVILSVVSLTVLQERTMLSLNGRRLMPSLSLEQSFVLWQSSAGR